MRQLLLPCLLGLGVLGLQAAGENSLSTAAETPRAGVSAGGLPASSGMSSPLATPSAPGTSSTPSMPAAVPDLASVAGLQAIHVGRLPSAYPCAYEPADEAQVKAVLGRVLGYMERQTPIGIMDADTAKPVPEGAPWPQHPTFLSTPLQNIGYEWGVSYAGLIEVWQTTGETAYREYLERRFAVLGRLTQALLALPSKERGKRSSVRGLVMPDSLDSCGAMAAALLKARAAGLGPDLMPVIAIDLAYVSHEQKRFEDGTLARSRPMPDSLWLDDLYMSVPALAQMGKMTGERGYFDDAARQLLQFKERLFVPEKGLFMHGWVKGMQDHPVFPWGRANGWAFMANVELLSVLPEDHPRRAELLSLLRAQARGLAACQGVNGLWHQLLDRPETYEESSASAMFVFGFARAINRGWLDPLVYGPVCSLGWNAVAGKVNAEGGVEACCVGTGMGFDPAFYAYRPVHVNAPHAYGPVLLAGAEMIRLRRGAGAKAVVHDGAVHFGEVPTRAW